MSVCKKCGEKDQSKFYKYKKRHYFCKKCFNTYCKQRWIYGKIKAVNYLGGKCSKCGIHGIHPALFDFHHKNPEEKEFSISQIRTYSWDRIKKELKKCELLCCFCHRLHHLKDDWEEVMKETNYELIDKNIILSEIKAIHNKPIKKVKISLKVLKTCICGKPINNRNKLCLVCNRKVKRPSKEELEKLVWLKPTSVIASEYGVSDNAIGKWCKNYGILKPSRGYWAKKLSGRL